MELASTLALVYAYNKARHKDEDEISALRSELGTVQAQSSGQALVLAATFLFHAGSPDKGRKLLDRAAETGRESAASLVTRGWIELATPQGRKRSRTRLERAQEAFHAARRAGGSIPDADVLLGVAACEEAVRDFPKALDALNEAIAGHPGFLPALTEKARVLVLQEQWEQATDVASRALDADSTCVDALVVTALVQVARLGDAERAQRTLRRLSAAIDSREPTNARLLHRVAAALARAAGRGSPLLRDTVDMLERASTLEPNDSSHVSERGHQLGLQGDYEAASDAFNKATTMDEGNMQALQGSILCQVERGQLADAAQQVEFLLVIAESLGPSADLAFVRALLALRHEGDPAAHGDLLLEALDTHAAAMRDAAKTTVKYTLEWYLAANHNFQVAVAEELLKTSITSKHEERALVTLKKVSLECPGLLRAQIVLAKARLANGDTDTAAQILRGVMAMSSSFSEALLLLAKISLARNDVAGASQQLEEAAAMDFEVRNSPLYHLLYARSKRPSDLDACVTTLELGLALKGVKRPAAGVTVDDADRASLFLELAEAYAEAGRLAEAEQVVRDAGDTFSRSTEAVRVKATSARLALKRNDVETAINMLSGVKPGQPGFADAQRVKADIYITHRRDKRKFIACHREILEQQPDDVNAVVAMGDAYMRVQVPEEAIKLYQRACNMAREAEEGVGGVRTNRTGALMLKVGRALVKTHDYSAAARFYESALAEAPERWTLVVELGRLRVDLRDFDAAVSLLKSHLRPQATLGSPSRPGGGGGSGDGGDADATAELSRLEGRAQMLLLLADVYRARGERDEERDVLESAREAQKSLLAGGRELALEVLKKHRLDAAVLCTRIGDHYTNTRGDADKGARAFREALSFDEVHVPALLALAKVARGKNDRVECKAKCEMLLRLDPTNPDASMMLADLFFEQQKYEEATQHFRRLVERDVTNYHHMFRLVTLLYRAGMLSDAPKYFDMAEARTARAKHTPGFRCCKGLYHQLMAETEEAIHHFNLARRDGAWGRIAIQHMVEMYLSPMGEPLWGNGTKRPSGLAVAYRLVQELPRAMAGEKRQILDAYVQIAHGRKAMNEAAINSLLPILRDNKDHVPALVALCTAFMASGQQPKARNQLKRVAKMPFQHEHAEEFEQAWLMLAELYANASKYDLAQELCNRALLHNRSSFRALTWLGQIAEKERAYADAAVCFERAWKIRKEASPQIGYQLAFNYLKAERWVEAVTVCQKVLQKHPGYNIKEPIMDKARANIRIASAM